MLNKLPIYQQLNNDLRERISQEKYRKGDKFLTERAICDQYGVSRTTANKVLSSLVSEGLLEFKKGLGTFIKSKPSGNRNSAEIVDFNEKAAETGRTIKSEIAEMERIDSGMLDSSVSAILQSEGDDEILKVEIVRRIDSLPVVREEHFFLCRYWPDLEELSSAEDLDQLISEECNGNMSVYGETIRAVETGGKEAKALNLDPGRAALCISRTGKTGKGIAIWYRRSLFKADSLEIAYTIQTGHPRSPLWGELFLTD